MSQPVLLTDTKTKSLGGFKSSKRWERNLGRLADENYKVYTDEATELADELMKRQIVPKKIL